MHCLTHSTTKLDLISFSEEDTRRLGYYIGNHAYPGLTVLLHGGLGMGKTLLTQGIGAALGCSRIKSPTFILIAEHRGKLPLIHADLYRLDSHGEADALDFENYIDCGAVVVVEWAERWHTPPVKDTLEIYIRQHGEDDCARKITIRALGRSAEVLLNKLICNILGSPYEEEVKNESSGH